MPSRLHGISKVNLFSLVGAVGLLFVLSLFVSRSQIGASTNCPSDNCGSIKITLAGKNVPLTSVKLYYEVHSNGLSGPVIAVNSLSASKNNQILNAVPVGTNYTITLKSLNDDVEPDFVDLANPLVLASDLTINKDTTTPVTVTVRKRTTGDLILFIAAKPGTMLPSQGKVADYSLIDQAAINYGQIKREGSFVLNQYSYSNMVKIAYLPAVDDPTVAAKGLGVYTVTLSNLDQAYSLYPYPAVNQYKDISIYKGSMPVILQFRLQNAGSVVASPSLPTTGVKVSLQGKDITNFTDGLLGRLTVTRNGQLVDVALVRPTYYSPEPVAYFDLPADTSTYFVRFEPINWTGFYNRYVIDSTIKDNTSTKAVKVIPGQLANLTFNLRRAERPIGYLDVNATIVGNPTVSTAEKFADVVATRTDIPHGQVYIGKLMRNTDSGQTAMHVVWEYNPELVPGIYTVEIKNYNATLFRLVNSPTGNNINPRTDIELLAGKTATVSFGFETTN